MADTSREPDGQAPRADHGPRAGLVGGRRRGARAALVVGLTLALGIAPAAGIVGRGRAVPVTAERVDGAAATRFAGEALVDTGVTAAPGHTTTASAGAGAAGASAAGGPDLAFAAAAGTLPVDRVVGIASTPDGTGFWTVTQTGQVAAHGHARAAGDLTGVTLNRPIVGIVASAGGDGYWLVAGDGGVFAFGDAPFLGSTGSTALNQPVVSLAPTPSGRGYWTVAADGGVFAFGDARFLGSMGGTPLNRPVTAMVRSDSGRGYRLVATDGGVFAFGDAPFLGSSGSAPPASPVVGLAAQATGTGYWLVTAAGQVLGFGAAAGSGAGTGSPSTGRQAAVSATAITGIAGNPAGSGYRIVHADGSTEASGPSAPGGGAATPATVRLVAVPASPPARGPHSFLATNDDGTPMRFDPCTPIRYVVNLNGEGPAVRALLDEAIERIEQATGLVFVDAGTTDEIPAKDRPIVLDRYGEGFAPVVLAFATPKQTDLLGKDEWGKGGFKVASSASGGYVAVTGNVVIAQGVGWRTDWDPAMGLGPLLLHEIGHLVGLGHVDDPTQIMTPGAPERSDFGAGDLEGLWDVGAAQRCLAVPDWRSFPHS